MYGDHSGTPCGVFHQTSLLCSPARNAANGPDVGVPTYHPQTIGHSAARRVNPLAVDARMNRDAVTGLRDIGSPLKGNGVVVRHRVALKKSEADSCS